MQRTVEPAQFNAADWVHFKSDLPLNKLRGRRAPRVPLSRYRVQTARKHAATTLNCSMSILRRRVLARFARSPYRSARFRAGLLTFFDYLDTVNENLFHALR